LLHHGDHNILVTGVRLLAIPRVSARQKPIRVVPAPHHIILLRKFGSLLPELRIPNQAIDKFVTSFSVVFSLFFNHVKGHNHNRFINGNDAQRRTLLADQRGESGTGLICVNYNSPNKRPCDLAEPCHLMPSYAPNAVNRLVQSCSHFQDSR
jgi:hypothetical protein